MGWEFCYSDDISVSNGVGQGSVLSPYLFAVYSGGLLSELSESGVGCYWGNWFVGVVCYANDIDLLASCPSAFKIMMNICWSYHGLKFNPSRYFT